MFTVIGSSAWFIPGCGVPDVAGITTPYKNRLDNIKKKVRVLPTKWPFCATVYSGSYRTKKQLSLFLSEGMLDNRKFTLGTSYVHNDGNDNDAIKYRISHLSMF